MHEMGSGCAFAGERVIILVDQHTVTVTHKTSGEVLGEYTIERTRKYWPKRKNPT